MDATGEGKLGSSSSNSLKSYLRTDSQASFSIHALVSRESSYQWDEFRRNELPSLLGSIPAGQESLPVQIMPKIAVHLRHAHVESLATFLMHRGIINATEHAAYLQSRRDWTSGMTKQDHLSILLNERVKLSSLAKECIPALFLSLQDSYEEGSHVPTGNHYNIARSLVEEAKRCAKLYFKTESKTLDDEDPISELRAAVELIPQTEFDTEKADLLIQNLELQISSSEFEKFTSYQQICLHWLDSYGDSCTMGLLVSALVKSGLGKLSSGLHPVYRSNPPRFRSFVMNLSAMGHNWKSLAYFLGYKDTDPEICSVDKYSPLDELKPRMFLRVFRIPDCEDQMESIVTEIISGVVKQKKVTENESNNTYPEWTKGGSLKVEGNEASNIYLADGNTMQAQKDYNAPKVQQQNTSEITKSNLNQGSVSSSGSKDKSQTIKPRQKYYHPSSGPIKEKKTEVPTSKPKAPPAKEQKQLKAENSSAAHMKPEVPNPIKQQSSRPSPQPQNPPQPKSIVTKIPQPPSYNDRVAILDLCMIGDDLCWPQVDRLLASMPILGEELESDEGKTAFQYVCRNGNIGRIRQMVARMANITHVDKCGRSVLHYNAVLTNQETLRIVLTGFRNKRMSVDVADNESFLTPLMVVCTIGDSACGSAKLLLEFGANPNGDQRAHSTPLIVACQSAAHNACPLVELLVNHGADVNKQDKDGYTLLLKACNTRKWNVAKYVLGLPQLTTINRSDRAGTNPLFEAVSQNNLEMAELLLRIGANTKIVRLQERNIPSLGSNSGVVETPFAHACRHGMLEMAKLLVAYHTDVNYKCSGVASALTFAAVNHKNNIVWYLLHECKGVDTSIYGLSTPISYSVKYKNHQCTKWMLDKLGGVEIAAQEADKVGMIDLFRDIEEYRLTCLSTATQVSAQHEQSHESDTFDTGLTSHRDEIEKVLYQFSKICMNVVKSKINLSELAGIASAVNPHVPEIGHFFQRCAKGHQNENSLKQDFLGPHKDVSPLSCVIQLQCISRQEFLVHTGMYFKGTLKPDEFVDRLVLTFHSISGDTETLSWNGTVVLDRLFSGQFSLSSISSQYDPGTIMQSTPPSRSEPRESFRRDDVRQGDELGWSAGSGYQHQQTSLQHTYPLATVSHGNIESPTIVNKTFNSGSVSQASAAHHWQPNTGATPFPQPSTSTPRSTHVEPKANPGYNIQQSMATLNPTRSSERESTTESSMLSYDAGATFSPPQLQQLKSIASESEESTVSLASSTYKDGIDRHLYDDSASNSVKKQPISHDSSYESSFERSNSEPQHTDSGVASGTDSPNQTTHVRTIPTNHNTELTSWRGLQRNINPREITFPTTSEQLGLGRYGSVEVVFYKGKEHAAKRFRKDFSEAQRSSIVKKFTTEFNILSSLKHDNIVEYVGAYFNPGNDLGLPLLIMEKLVTNLKSYLEPDEGNGDPPALSMQLKLSILHDTASGLHFLHTLKPTAVIHRDLTATNVLLDENHRAKIADFGNSCVIDVDATTAVSMTCNPGTLLYSAPEVTERVYGTPVDIFSFGHLALFTINQKEPRDIRKSFTVLPNRRKTLLTEVDRRDKYFKMAYEQLEQDHVIIRMIKQCLDDEPEYRPTTTEIKVILADELKPAGQTSAATNPRTM